MTYNLWNEVKLITLILSVAISSENFLIGNLNFGK